MWFLERRAEAEMEERGPDAPSILLLVIPSELRSFLLLKGPPEGPQRPLLARASGLGPFSFFNKQNGEIRLLC